MELLKNTTNMLVEIQLITGIKNVKYAYPISEPVLRIVAQLQPEKPVWFGDLLGSDIS
jgi:hypothetical protein